MNLTAKVVVNGDTSDNYKILYNIRQVFSHVPSPLFIKAVDPLGLTLQQARLEGISLTKGQADAHLLVCSAFVDDSAIVLRRRKQLLLALKIVDEFGELSGYKFNHSKASLNSAFRQQSNRGIPVLPPGESMRYLGIKIGHGMKHSENWSTRLKSIKAKLVTAI